MFGAGSLLNEPGDSRITAATSIFTANSPVELTHVSLFGASGVTSFLYHVPKGEMQGDQHTIFRTEEILDAFKSECPGLGPVLDEGDSLWVSADGAGVFPMAYGVSTDENPEPPEQVINVTVQGDKGKYP